VSDTKLVLVSVEGDYILLDVDEANKELIEKEKNNLIDETS
jgi:hypothetical protein